MIKKIKNALFPKKETSCPWHYFTSSRCGRHIGDFVQDEEYEYNGQVGMRGYYKNICITDEYPKGREGEEYCRVMGRRYWQFEGGHYFGPGRD